MKSTTKKISLLGLGALCALSVSLGGALLTGNHTVNAAVGSAPDATAYFYDNLIDENGNEYTLAKKFYEALDDMYENNDFVDGVVDYSINSIATSDQLKAWVENGNLEVPKAFSAARDAFLTDHPEIFYINFYKMTISVAKSGGNYVGYINSGREANLYYDNGFKTQADVEKAITAFENKIDEIVEAVNETEESKYVARDVLLAKEVNNYLAKYIKYDYASYDNKDDPNYVAAAYINTPYGGLVEGKAVCGGFSTAYKVIMDKLGIPCITVNGYSNNKDESGNNSGSSVYHMWNYVYLENPNSTSAQALSSRATASGAWYSVDVTWDTSAYSLTRYAVLSAPVDAELHVTDGVISSGGYELVYPELSPYTYGGTVDTDGLQLTLTYEPSSYTDNYGDTLYNTFFHVSYNGKDAKRLFEEDGLYLAFRYAYYKEVEVEGEEETESELVFTWTNWHAIEYWRLALNNGNDGQNDYDMIQNTGNETRVYGNSSEYYVQVAVFDTAPTVDLFADVDPHDPVTEFYYYYYFSDEAIEKTTAVAVSNVEENLTFGTYNPPPYIVYDTDTTDNFASVRVISDSMHRSGSNLMDEKHAFTLTATYNEELHILDETKPIGITFTSIHPNAKDYAFFVPFEDGAYVHLLDDNCTLEFKFCPSLMYEHNRDDYFFFFSNVGSKKLVKVRDENGELVDGYSNKLPNSTLYCFERVYMACPKVFNYDGRLWVDVCAQPTLVSNSDLSASNFLSEDGESTFSENERSQMMLVAERVDSATENAILDGIGDIEGSAVTKDDIKTSETYDIFLQICNSVPVIPDGSYVKIALGFPEGYGPNDEGVTFKIYHRKHVGGNEYIIEEIPCVVTQFGIVAVCTSFSPYMVAVVDAEFATTKNVYASIEGYGGKLSAEDGKIQALNEGESYTYTIQPDDGYSIYSVKLNGVEVKESIVNGKLTVAYSDLDANNELVIQYIADEAAARMQQKIDNNEIDEVVVVETHVNNAPLSSGSAGSGSDDSANVPGPGASTDIGAEQPDGGLTPLAIVAIVLAVCAVIAVGAVIGVIIAKRKKND